MQTTTETVLTRVPMPAREYQLLELLLRHTNPNPPRIVLTELGIRVNQISPNHTWAISCHITSPRVEIPTPLPGTFELLTPLPTLHALHATQIALTVKPCSIEVECDGEPMMSIQTTIGSPLFITDIIQLHADSDSTYTLPGSTMRQDVVLLGSKATRMEVHVIPSGRVVALTAHEGYIQRGTKSHPLLSAQRLVRFSHTVAFERWAPTIVYARASNYQNWANALSWCRTVNLGLKADHPLVGYFHSGPLTVAAALAPVLLPCDLER